MNLAEVSQLLMKRELYQGKEATSLAVVQVLVLSMREGRESTLAVQVGSVLVKVLERKQTVQQVVSRGSFFDASLGTVEICPCGKGGRGFSEGYIEREKRIKCHLSNQRHSPLHCVPFDCLHHHCVLGCTQNHPTSRMIWCFLVVMRLSVCVVVKSLHLEMTQMWEYVKSLSSQIYRVLRPEIKGERCGGVSQRSIPRYTNS